MKNKCYIIVFSLGLFACSKPVQREINDAVKVNKKAQSLVEWETADQNPRNLFKNLRSEIKTNTELPQDVCEGLMELSSQDLTLFEEEIKSRENAELLKSCREKLIKKLEDYWREQKKSLQTSGLNFNFHPRVGKRDLSKGYRAATGDVQPKELVLTFDDGPHTQYTPLILDILRAVNAKVMFFTVGPHVRENPTLIYREAMEGHVIGSHSLSHRCLASNPMCAKANKGIPLTFDEAVAEIRGGHQAVYDILGFVDPFFRFPYGESDPALRSYLASKQVAQMFWNIDSADWKSQSNMDLLKNTLERIDKVQRGIVVFHDTQRRTLEILPEFLKAIYERGYNLVILQSMDEKAREHSQLVTKAAKIH